LHYRLADLESFPVISQILAQTGWMDTHLGKAVLIIGIPLAIGLSSDLVFEFIRRRRRANQPDKPKGEDAS
jgi:hypothetical protein